MGRPRTIFFDVGNTLLFPNREVILAPLREHSAEPSLELWQAIERRTKQEFDHEMQSGRADHGFWQLFYTHLLNEMGIAAAGLDGRLVELTRNSANWGGIRPGTRQRLETFCKRFDIAVISNADGKIVELLTAAGIADCFQSITDSAIVGYEKPHPEIFAAALREMKAQPEDSLYVGDVYSVDYLGARGAGMQAVLFDVSGAYREKGLPRVESLEELEAAVGINGN